MEEKKRSFIALFIGLLVAIFIYFLVPATPIAPQGIFLPIDKLRSPLQQASQVTFYNPSLLPALHQKIGYINVQFHTKTPTQASELQLVQYVRQLAAQAGANGVLINLFGHTMPSQVSSSQQSYVFRGLAVYAIPNV